MDILFFYVKSDEINLIEDGIAPASVVDTIDANTIEKDGIEFSRIMSIEDINACINAGLSIGITVKQARDCIKYSAGITGFSNLTEGEKAICSKWNVGTGAEILQGCPDLLDRVSNSYNYLVLVGGEPSGIAKIKSTMLQAIVFAACKHIVLPNGVALPEAILTFLNTDSSKWGVSILGTSYLDLYEGKRLQGVCKGDGITGLYDWFNSTVGSDYENMGMNEVFASIPNEAWVLGGFANVQAFSSYCLRYLDTGLLQ